MNGPDKTKASFLLDTGPLSVLCGFPIKKIPYIHVILQHTILVLPDAVIGEIQGAGKMARIIPPLLQSGKIQSFTTPTAPLIVDTAYGRGLGPGERTVIKCSLETHLPPVIDDQDAFIVACRFGLHPIGFQDFIVRLVIEHGLSQNTAVEIVQVTARQFPAMYLAHTLDMLR
jgi:hypothetical protein